MSDKKTNAKPLTKAQRKRLEAIKAIDMSLRIDVVNALTRRILTMKEITPQHVAGLGHAVGIRFSLAQIPPQDGA